MENLLPHLFSFRIHLLCPGGRKQILLQSVNCNFHRVAPVHESVRRSRKRFWQGFISPLAAQPPRFKNLGYPSKTKTIKLHWNLYFIRLNITLPGYMIRFQPHHRYRGLKRGTSDSIGDKFCHAHRTLLSSRSETHRTNCRRHAGGRDHRRRAGARRRATFYGRYFLRSCQSARRLGRRGAPRPVAMDPIVGRGHGPLLGALGHRVGHCCHQRVGRVGRPGRRTHHRPDYGLDPQFARCTFGHSKKRNSSAGPPAI